MISIIVPIYNEEKILSSEQEYFRMLSRHAELLFIDGGSTDRSCRLAASHGRVIRTEKGRAVQMNSGALEAAGETLFFLHADTKIKSSALENMEKIIARGFIGGCLRQVIDAPQMIFRWIALTGNLRAKHLKIFYGDQGIFVKKDIFHNLGKYPHVPIGEDVLFSKVMRKSGKTCMLEDAIVCSPRRWTNQGILKTFFLNAYITIKLLFGLDLKRAGKAYADIR